MCRNVQFDGLTYAGIMVPDVQKIPTTSAFITAPGILAATFRALASFLLFAFINVCEEGKRENSTSNTPH